MPLVPCDFDEVRRKLCIPYEPYGAYDPLARWVEQRGRDLLRGVHGLRAAGPFAYSGR